MRDTTKLIADLRYWQEHSTSKGKLFKAAADEIETCNTESGRWTAKRRAYEKHFKAMPVLRRNCKC